MNGTWHRVGVYLGLLEDPDRRVRLNAERPDVEEAGTAVSVLVLATTSVLFAVGVFVVHLATGDDTSVGRIAVTAVIYFLMTLTFRALFTGIKHLAAGPGASERESRDE